jgi:hypothetical protein
MKTLLFFFSLAETVLLKLIDTLSSTLSSSNRFALGGPRCWLDPLFSVITHGVTANRLAKAMGLVLKKTSDSN